MNVRRAFVVIAIVLIFSLGTLYIFWEPVKWIAPVVLAVLILGFYDMFQKKHTIKRNFPVVGNFRYLLESVRPEIMQYFVETDTEGRPINRIFRSLIYRRAKGVNDTAPFGTQSDVYAEGYEWMNHSLYAQPIKHLGVDAEPRVLIGGKDCTQPYSSSLLNISAMSYGSLSRNAVLAMNSGAQKGKFAQNTGEGGITPHHKEPGGDLIWQIGTGYFGCRHKDGTFNEEMFTKNATLTNVKMIEVKLSQGAKPGHGGILPAKKNTPEIAEIRGVEQGTDVLSPPTHSSFSNPEGLMHFIKKLRDLSGGKPVGFKLCLGKKSEFKEICKAMISTGIKPDFISIDGGEGGTGAAPIEFANSMGMPLRDGLALAIDMLRGYDLKKDIKVIAAGKVFSGFHMARVIALGADLVYSARAMMMATGCIQALVCNTNACPVGVATQDEKLMKGLVVEDKADRVFNFHHETVKSFVELMGASGIENPEQLSRVHINRRIIMDTVKRYDEIYPEVTEGAYLN